MFLWLSHQHTHWSIMFPYTICTYNTDVLNFLQYHTIVEDVSIADNTVYIHTYTHARTHTHTYIAYMHTYIHSIHTCIHTYIHTCMHACMIWHWFIREFAIIPYLLEQKQLHASSWESEMLWTKVYFYILEFVSLYNLKHSISHKSSKMLFWWANIYFIISVQKAWSSQWIHDNGYKAMNYNMYCFMHLKICIIFYKIVQGQCHHFLACRLVSCSSMSKGALAIVLSLLHWCSK